MTTTSIPGTAARPFGRVLCAMVTPFTSSASRELDLPAARELAARLVDGGCDGLVLNGTTGESPTTTDEEKTALVRAVAEEVGGRAAVVAGVGSASTAHTVALAREAERAGADGLLVVAPYYSRPPQDAVETHLRTVADATELPVMLYDIPARTGTRIETGTMLRLAEHERIVAVKDCAYDLFGSTKVMGRTSLAYYSGCEELNLPLYALGGAGCVSTVANVAPGAVRGVLDAFDAGACEEAARLNQLLLPLVELMMAAGLPGAVTAKSLLDVPLRAPLQPASAAVRSGLRAALDALPTP
ncbi:4-hydroxy-tetrahydrodipicolinate synthase [Streptomyces sp. NPDC048111]|uniref:4-hydroxy-tetrahydrodipicolinate synthase n=1 Tax=Streptomyces sp. NPDC048111 TaxID=3365500 RepID=UPI00371DDB44